MSFKSIKINGKQVKLIKLNGVKYYQSFPEDEYERLEYITILCDDENGYHNYILTQILASEVDYIAMKISKSSNIFSTYALMILHDTGNSWIGITFDNNCRGNIGTISNWNVLLDGTDATITFNLESTSLNQLSTGYWDDRFYSFTHKEYGFQYKKNGVALCDTIPCRRISDGVCGMYDLVSGLFLTNAGVGGNDAIIPPE